ncbi:hypothetical protein AcW1_008999 [Taiwanofungus camphoratus]|nr:hypothetical protein AcW1_008999 [Antrodia cinnamomea]
MSTDDSATAEIISDVQYYVGTNYCIVATFALVAYEYTITLPQEIELVWRSKMTSANAIFLLNRAVLLASAVVNFLNFFSWSTNTRLDTFLKIFPPGWTL